MKRLNKKQANALILTVSVLFILSSVGISFSQLMIMESKAAVNYCDAFTASLLAQAGMNYAIQKLRDDFSRDPTKVTRDWLYRTLTDIATFKPLTEIGIVPIEGQTSSEPECWPSYCVNISDEDTFDPLLGRKVSGRMGEDPTKVYTLKILGTSSQIHLNSMIDVTNTSDDYGKVPMGKILNTLSQAIYDDTTTKYKSLPNAHSKGPLRGLGEEIIAYRNTCGGFLNKNEVIGTYGSETITPEDFEYIKDYLTVYPVVNEMAKMSISRNIRPYTGNETFQKDYRIPVDINSVSKNVLFSLLHNIGTSSVILSTTETTNLVNNIITERQTKKFASWDDFYKFMDWQNKKVSTTQIGAFYDTTNNKPVDDALIKIAIVKANADPNVTLRRTNPDAPIYQKVNKTDFTHRSLEFCFFPIGLFEITVLGQVLDANGTPKVAKQLYSTIRIYDLINYHTQYDFEGGNSSLFYQDTSSNPSLVNRILLDKTVSGELITITKGYNGFSYGNNIQKLYSSATDIKNACADRMGHILPLGYALSTANFIYNTSQKQYSEVDNNIEYYYRFKSDYNGTMDGLYAPYENSNGTWSGTNVAAQGSKANYFNATTQRLIPEDGTSTAYCDLSPDGVLVRPGDTRELFYITSTSTAPNNTSGLFPKISNSLVSDWSENYGTMLFWFKIGREWLDQDYPIGHLDRDKEFRTVFLATTYFKNTISGVEYNCGFQREVQMLVCGVKMQASPPVDQPYATEEHPNMPLLRKVNIRIRYKFFCYKQGSTTPVNPQEIPSNYIKYEQELQFEPGVTINDCFGMHAQEWYHIAIRWWYGIEPFLSAKYDNNEKDNYSVIINGVFYRYEDSSKTSEFNQAQAKKVLADKDVEIYSTYISSGGGNGKEGNILIADDQFAALYPDECLKNRLYVGYFPYSNGGTTVVPAKHSMTIDDVRISDSGIGMSQMTTGGVEKYNPSRFPLPVDINKGSTLGPNFCFGTFEGKFKGQLSGTVVFVYWTARSWGDVTLIPKTTSSQNVPGTDYPKTVWLELWNMMTDAAPASSISFNDRIKNTTTNFLDCGISVKKKKTKKGVEYWAKEVRLYKAGKYKIEFERHDWDRLMHDEYRLADSYSPKEGTDLAAEATTVDGVLTAYNFTCFNQPLYKILRAWYDFMKAYPSSAEKKYFSWVTKTTDENGNEVDDLNSLVKADEHGYTPGQADKAEVLDNKKEYTYTVKFPITNPAAPTIFQSPIVDDISLLYVNDDVIFLEYTDN